METRILVEEPAFRLSGGSVYSDERTKVAVSWAELKAAPVGTAWVAANPSNVIRDEWEQEATVVYKEQRGCAVLFRYYRSSDTDDYQELEPEIELVWFEFNE